MYYEIPPEHKTMDYSKQAVEDTENNAFTCSIDKQKNPTQIDFHKISSIDKIGDVNVNPTNFYNWYDWPKTKLCLILFF